ncbi:helix-turn-helix transcriptional regulator [Stigmatella aurantiaca]|uniref:Two-component response regulator n=1 Tax=Stigmatella aurantiaca (strain DW4/3-1) TaxID=378806 RepID=Q099R4_STIAD|nr:helix-turn-helix transcriptional regulator [Stigmatella aurantiaca]ADO75879.1 Two-component response regulator [Stigmatella aurantiaca DW4/3-1]EAU68450.1 two-component response regulator [Stigmatella aurantiaca DW4/3-1]
MRTPLPPGSRSLLVFPAPSSPHAPGSGGPVPAGELIIDGQRYHLVPALEAPGLAPPLPAPAARVLTARELQIASHVAAGRVNKEIAAALDISTWTVAAHLRRIFSKLGVDTRAAMVSRCFSGAPGAAPPARP